MYMQMDVITLAIVVTLPCSFGYHVVLVAVLCCIFLFSLHYYQASTTFAGDGTQYMAGINFTLCSPRASEVLARATCRGHSTATVFSYLTAVSKVIFTIKLYHAVSVCVLYKFSGSLYLSAYCFH